MSSEPICPPEKSLVPLPVSSDEQETPEMDPEKSDAQLESPPTVSDKSAYFFAFLSKERPLPSQNEAHLMLATMFMSMFMQGWNDGSQGPILPSLQKYYRVDYLIVSLIWVFNFVGFLTAGLTNVYIADRIGFGIATPLALVVQSVGYALMSWGGPFPVFILGFALIGFGLGLQVSLVSACMRSLVVSASFFDTFSQPSHEAPLYAPSVPLPPTPSPLRTVSDPSPSLSSFPPPLHGFHSLPVLSYFPSICPLTPTHQDALVNSLCTRLPNASIKMFACHAIYGLGATVAPLVSTIFVEKVSRFYLYYTISLSLALLTSLSLVLVFRGRTEDQIVGKRVPLEGESKDNDASSGGKMKRIMRIPAVHFMAFYLMIYVGVEVGTGGWATTFLQQDRNGNANSGYVTTGFFGGLMLGRIILLPVTSWIGKQNAIYVYSLFTIVLQLIIWFTKNLIGDAVCFALIGLLLGPMYPIVMMVCVDVLPGELQGGAIGWCASLGQAGSAILPFVTGSISQRYGIWILQPLMIAMVAFSCILWALVPRSRVRISA